MSRRTLFGGGSGWYRLAPERAPVFIGPDASVADLLRDMRRHRRPFVIVREAGQALGIVTIEDAVEQVVGAIEREVERSPAATSQMVLAAAATPSTVIQIDALRAQLRAPGPGAPPGGAPSAQP